MNLITKTNRFKTTVDQTGRICTSCQEYKLWECFKGHLRSKTGRSSQCKTCYKERRRSVGRVKERRTNKTRDVELKLTNPTLLKARGIRSKLMARHNKIGMEREHIPTALVIKDWLDAQMPAKCYYSGVEVDLFKCHVDHKQPLGRGGDSRLGNLCVTDPKINSAKGQMTEKEFKQLLELISTWEDGGQYLLMRLRQGFMGKGKFNK